MKACLKRLIPGRSSPLVRTLTLVGVPDRGCDSFGARNIFAVPKVRKSYGSETEWPGHSIVEGAVLWNVNCSGILAQEPESPRVAVVFGCLCKEGIDFGLVFA